MDMNQEEMGKFQDNLEHILVDFSLEIIKKIKSWDFENKYNPIISSVAISNIVIAHVQNLKLEGCEKKYIDFFIKRTIDNLNKIK